MNDKVNVDKVVLQKMKIAVGRALSPQMMDVDVDAFIDDFAGSIYVEAKGFIWQDEKPVQKQEITFPTTWWDAFKDRWYPNWALRRWPVNYRHIKCEVRATYPEYKELPRNKFGKVVYHVLHEDHTWWDLPESETNER